jgi:rhamnosyltransferase
MLYAAKVMKAGYQVAYVAEAEVVHSHNYTCKQQFKRNFDLGVSQAEHPEVFDEVPSEKEGMRSVKGTIRHLRKKEMRRKIPYVILQSGCKYLGYFLGKRYKKLPHKWVMKFTSNKEYWANAQRRSEVKSIDATKGYGRADSERGKK